MKKSIHKSKSMYECCCGHTFIKAKMVSDPHARNVRHRICPNCGQMTFTHARRIPRKKCNED